MSRGTAGLCTILAVYRKDWKPRHEKMRENSRPVRVEAVDTFEQGHEAGMCGLAVQAMVTLISAAANIRPSSCQPMVTGASSTPTGIPNLKYGEKGNYLVHTALKL